MTKTLKLTRRGWIGHLALVQNMIEAIEEIYRIPTYRSVIGPKDCETDRRKKIARKFQELLELLWETSAVSEKILREQAAEARCGIDELEGTSREPWSEDDRAAEAKSKEDFARAAKDLELWARSLWDETAPETVDPEVVYPGGEGADETQPPQPEKEDPRQLTFEMKEPPTVDPDHIIDYKMQQANDDTATPPEEEES